MRSRAAALVLVALVLLLPPAICSASVAGEAEQAGEVPRIGVLLPGSPEGSHLAYALRDGLREFGYVEGQNIAIEWRWSYGLVERFTQLVAELVRFNVDAIVAGSNEAVAAAQRATRTIPTVMVMGADPVDLGIVASLARPGGNITGLAFRVAEVGVKRLQLLKKAVPKLSRVAVLWDPTHVGSRLTLREAEGVASALGLQLQFVEARNPSELDGAFAAMTREGVGAVYVVGTTSYIVHRAQIAEHAVKSRLPASCPTRVYAETGCLMSYGVNIADMYRRAAYYVNRILKGAKPGDLPIEQPTKFELVINMRTAKALGLTIPQSLLLRADEIIQ